MFKQSHKKYWRNLKRYVTQNNTFLIAVFYLYRWQVSYCNNELHRQNKYDRDILFTTEEHNSTHSNVSNSVSKCEFISKNDSWIKMFTPECSFSIACLASVRCDCNHMRWLYSRLVVCDIPKLPSKSAGKLINYKIISPLHRNYKTPFARAFERRTAWKLARADDAKISRLPLLLLSGAFRMRFC